MRKRCDIWNFVKVFYSKFSSVVLTGQCGRKQSKCRFIDGNLTFCFGGEVGIHENWSKKCD